MFRRSRDYSPLGVAGGALLGALGAFLLDPRLGRRRRALVRDKLIHITHLGTQTTRLAARDAYNRTRGALADLRERIHPRPIPDNVLEERVRAKLGRACSHPHAITVKSEGRCVELSGRVLRNELDEVVRAASHVKGVDMLTSKLEIHNRPDTPELQGGRLRTGERFELLQNHWSPATRVAMGLAGTWMLVRGVMHRHGLGVPESVMGAGLLARTLRDHR